MGDLQRVVEESCVFCFLFFWLRAVHCHFLLDISLGGPFRFYCCFSYEMNTSSFTVSGPVF